MKQLSMKYKIICAVLIITIVAGITVVAKKGFNFELKNNNAQKIEIYLGKQFLIPNIKEIANETLGTKEIVIQKVEVFDEAFDITAKEITEEQKANFIQKINEMYGVEIKAEDIKIENVPHVHFRDMMKPYILPLVISTAIILVYIGVRYLKIGILKSIIKTASILIIAEMVLFSLMAITRFPIGRYTFPLIIFVYLVTLLGITINLEIKLKEKKIVEQEN